MMQMTGMPGAEQVSEDQFVNSIKINYPGSQLKKYLNVDIIPNEALDDSNMKSTLDKSRMSLRNWVYERHFCKRFKPWWCWMRN